MKMLSRLNVLLEERRDEILNKRNKGKKVFGYVCCKVPIEIVHALDMIPIRIGIATQEKMSIGKEYIHQFTCPYIKCIAGEMLEQGSFFHENVDIISGYVTCLAVHRCLEVLKQYTGKPTFYLTHPLNPPTERERKFYEGEIVQFVSQLEMVAGKKLNPDCLKKSVDLFNRIRENLKKLYRLQSLNGFPMKWSEVFEIIHAGFLLDANQYLAFLDETVREAEAQKAESKKTDAGPRIMLIGSPILPGDNLLIDVIEDCGARIVADTLCTGLRTFEDLIIKEPSVEGIAKTYLHSTPCASAQDLDLDKDRRLNHILRLIREYEVQGVVYYALRFCDHYAFKDDETKEFLAEKASVPMVAIHSEYGETEKGRLLTRIEGFLETL
jgi:benzoyl-CoA reductase/2-hydroxyglutaryl-CoA dehydratase subunit BcrC/BadD/HgdB